MAGESIQREAARVSHPAGRCDVRSYTGPCSLLDDSVPAGSAAVPSLQRALSEHPAWKWEQGDSSLRFLPLPALLQKQRRAGPVHPKKGHTPWLGGRRLRWVGVGAAAGQAVGGDLEPLS